MNAGIQKGRVEARAIRSDDVLPGVGKVKFLFVLGAFISFVLSVSLFFTGNREQGIFVGIWVPSILSAGALLLGSNGHE